MGGQNWLPPFNENDEVYAVGAATQKAADRPRLFADGFTVSLK